METNQINLFVYDTSENFAKSKVLLGEEGSTFKTIVCIESAAEFQTKLAALDDEEYLFLVVHVFSENINGIKRFVSSGITSKDKPLEIMYISDGDARSIKHQMIDAELGSNEIYKYHQVHSNLAEGKFNVITKSQFLTGAKDDKLSKIEYCVITALFQDEFEELKKIFDFRKPNGSKQALRFFILDI